MNMPPAALHAGKPGRRPLPDQVRRKVLVAARVNDEQRRRFDALRALRGLTEAEMVRAMVDEMYAEKLGHLDSADRDVAA